MTHAARLLRVPRFTVFLLSLLSMAAPADTTSTATVVTTQDQRSAQSEPDRRPIQFKQESKRSDFAELKPLAALGIIALFAVAAAFWLKKKRPALLARLGGSGGRIKVVETRMATARLSLCLIEFDGKELLLAVNGDNVIQLHAGTPLPTPAEYPFHDNDSTK